MPATDRRQVSFPFIKFQLKFSLLARLNSAQRRLKNSLNCEMLLNSKSLKVAGSLLSSYGLCLFVSITWYDVAPIAAN